MDANLANHAYETMFPKPLEMICYHCQQASEKFLKALIVNENQNAPRTHDLGILSTTINANHKIPESILDACDNLTPYGIRVRYPQEIHIEEVHTKKSLDEMEKIKSWVNEILSEQ